MEIAQEWLDFEKNVLGQRPLISGSVEEVRAAYETTSETLKAQLPDETEYNAFDCMQNLFSAFCLVSMAG